MNPTRTDIKSETLTLIQSQAKNLGSSVDEYLRGLLPPDERELALGPDSDKDDFEADMLAFADDSGDSPLYTGTYSREDIYFDHD